MEAAMTETSMAANTCAYPMTTPLQHVSDTLGDLSDNGPRHDPAVPQEPRFLSDQQAPRRVKDIHQWCLTDAQAASAAEEPSLPTAHMCARPMHVHVHGSGTTNPKLQPASQQSHHPQTCTAPCSTQFSSSRTPLPQLAVVRELPEKVPGNLPAFTPLGLLAGHLSHADATATATVTITSARTMPSASPPAPPPAAAAAAAVTGKSSAGGWPLQPELQAKLPQQQQQQGCAGMKPQPWMTTQHHQQQQGCAAQAHELQLLLLALHAEYKLEMQLMLKACQVAGKVTRHSSAAAGSSLLLDPATRQQLQRQVLGNCNDKHAAVIAAFRQAAQAVEDAAAVAAVAAADGVHGSSRPDPSGVSVSVLAGRKGGVATGSGASEAELQPCVELQRDAELQPVSLAFVQTCLQHLQDTYRQELVASTSALFAICRGFGQHYALTSTATAAVKGVLAAAQQQHRHVEQLWRDLEQAAGGL